MKKRIKIDTSILTLIIIGTGFLYLWPWLYSRDLFWDNVFDFIGLIAVLKGVYLRMAARGYKKQFSQSGSELVSGGPYTLTRNPMYLGSFTIGAGFVLIVWPWWLVIVYTILFYMRFNRQIVSEEAHLTKTFGDAYMKYCQKVPRLFPRLKTMLKIKVKEAFPWEDAWSTKERWGLLGWPALAVVLEILQEGLVYGAADMGRIAAVFVAGAITFFIGLWLRYNVR